jgi:predicted phage tail protein
LEVSVRGRAAKKAKDAKGMGSAVVIRWSWAFAGDWTGTVSRTGASSPKGALPNELVPMGTSMKLRGTSMKLHWRIGEPRRRADEARRRTGELRGRADETSSTWPWP